MTDISKAYWDDQFNGWFLQTQGRGSRRVDKEVGQSLMTLEEVEAEEKYLTLLDAAEMWNDSSYRTMRRLEDAYNSGAADKAVGNLADHGYGERKGYTAKSSANLQAFYDGGYGGIPAKNVDVSRPNVLDQEMYEKCVKGYADDSFCTWSAWTPDVPAMTYKKALAERGPPKLVGRLHYTSFMGEAAKARTDAARPRA